MFIVCSKIHIRSVKMILILTAAHALTEPLKRSVYPLPLHLMLNPVLPLPLHSLIPSKVLSPSCLSAPSVPVPTRYLPAIPAFFHFNACHLLSCNTLETLFYFLQRPLWSVNWAGMCFFARWPEVGKCWLSRVAQVACSSACLLARGCQVDQKNDSAPWQARKKSLVLYGNVSVALQKCVACACQSLDPPLILAYVFFLRESNESPFYVPGDQEAERWRHVSVKMQPMALASEFPFFNIVCVTHRLYNKALALAEKDTGRLIN